MPDEQKTQTAFDQEKEISMSNNGLVDDDLETSAQEEGLQEKGSSDVVPEENDDEGKYRLVDGTVPNRAPKNESAAKSDEELGISELQESVTVKGETVAKKNVHINARLLTVIIMVVIFVVLLGVGIAGYYFFYAAKNSDKERSDDHMQEAVVLNEMKQQDAPSDEPMPSDATAEEELEVSNDGSAVPTKMFGAVKLSRVQFVENDQVGERSEYGKLNDPLKDEGEFTLVTQDHVGTFDALEQRNTFADATRIQYPEGNVQTESNGQEYFVSFIVRDDVEGFVTYNVRKFEQHSDGTMSSYHFAVKKRGQEDAFSAQEMTSWLDTMRNL